MKKLFIGFVIISYSLLGIVLWKNSYQKPKVAPQAVAQEVTLSSEGLWNTIQKWRLDNGYKQYIRSRKLCEIADIRAVEIVQNFNHNAFNADRFGINGTISENLANGPSSDAECLNGWLSSPSHAAALRANYTHSCVRTNGVRAVQIFGYY